MDATVVGVLVIVALVGYAVFSVLHREKAGRRSAQSGEDQARVRALLQKALPQEASFTPVYVHMAEGRHAVTHYVYALAVQPELDRFWVVPVGKEGDLLYPGRPFRIALEELGGVYFSCSDEQSAGERISISDFYDAERKRIFRLEVKDFEYREDRYHWLDVYQPEEASVFFRMMESWAAKKPLEAKKKR